MVDELLFVVKLGMLFGHGFGRRSQNLGFVNSTDLLLIYC